MAGDADEARRCVLLFFITVFMRLVFIRRRNRFQQRLRLLTIRGRRRRTKAYFFAFAKEDLPQKKSRMGSRKATILVRTYASKPIRRVINRSRRVIERKIIHLRRKKTTPWSQKFSETHKNRTGVLYFRFQVRFDSFVRWADHKLLLIGGNWLLTRLSYLGRWLKFNENCIEVCRLA